MAVTAVIKGRQLIITADLGEPTESGSGKSLVVASTHGNATFPDVKIAGKPLTVGLNAYIKK